MERQAGRPAAHREDSCRLVGAGIARPRKPSSAKTALPGAWSMTGHPSASGIRRAWPISPNAKNQDRYACRRAASAVEGTPASSSTVAAEELTTPNNLKQRLMAAAPKSPPSPIRSHRPVPEPHDRPGLISGGRVQQRYGRIDSLKQGTPRSPRRWPGRSASAAAQLQAAMQGFK